MGDLKTAVRKLLENDRTILPDALEILKSSSNPIDLADAVLASSSNSTPVNREILVQVLRGTSTPKKPKSRKPSKRRGRVLDSLLGQNKKSVATSKSKSKPANKKFRKRSNKTVINTSLDDLSDGLSNYESQLEIIRNPELSQNLVGDINDMVGYFQDRYKKLSAIFRGRTDINNLMKIKDVRKNQKDITVIGMLTEKSFTNDNSGKVILEDPSTEKILEAVITDETLIEEALHIMTDTVLCLRGSVSERGVFYVQEFILPDVPQRPISARKLADQPVHAAFLSDIHIGSKVFLSDPMEKFIEFLNGRYGDLKMQKLGEHTKYVMFSGDVVDGVGIYPGQQDDLAMDSIHDQYNEFARFVDEIPEDVEIVVIPGNHDMVRSAEPQPSISPQYAPDLAGLDNVHLLPNPSQVSLHGIQTLLYHCTSLPDIMNHIPGLPVEKPVDVMIHMLKARHLAPIWGDKTPIATEPEDHLVIDPLPDIFHGGHIHINGYGRYRGVDIVNSGTMQAQTSYQKSLNIDPTPGQVPIINLQTRDPSLIDFMRK